MDNLEEKAFVGTGLKFVLEITAAGFDMQTDDFELTLKRGPKSIVIQKAEMLQDAQDNFIVCFDSAELGTGVVQAIVTAYVPDLDFPTGIRKEITKFDLILLNA